MRVSEAKFFLLAKLFNCYNALSLSLYMYIFIFISYSWNGIHTQWIPIWFVVVCTTNHSNSKETEKLAWIINAIFKIELGVLVTVTVMVAEENVHKHSNGIIILNVYLHWMIWSTVVLKNCVRVRNIKRWQYFIFTCLLPKWT